MEDQPIPPKKTKGQQKIDLKLIGSSKRRSVTFTKRKGGLFHKAEELNKLTGADVAIMIISPGHKVFISEKTNAQRVINRYKDQVTSSPMIEQQKAELRELLKQLKIEDNRTKALRNNRNLMRAHTFMAAPPFTYSKAQIDEMKQKLLLLNNVLSHPPPGFFNSSYSGAQESSGFSCGPFMTPVIGNQNFGGNMVLTPCGNRNYSAGTHQNHMSRNNMWSSSHGNFYTDESASMLLMAAQNQMSHQDMFATPHDSMIFPPLTTQNNITSGSQNERW